MYIVEDILRVFRVLLFLELRISDPQTSIMIRFPDGKRQQLSLSSHSKLMVNSHPRNLVNILIF